MSKTRAQKEQMLSQAQDKLARTTTAVFTGFSGLKIADTDALRQSMREVDGEFAVVKKNLLLKALSAAGHEFDAATAPSEVAVAFGYGDEVAPARVVNDFAKKNKQLVILGGLFNGRLTDVQQIQMLASIPGRDELYAKIVGSMASPLRGLVGVLQGNLRGLVGVLSAIKDQKS